MFDIFSKEIVKNFEQYNDKLYEWFIKMKSVLYEKLKYSKHESGVVDLFETEGEPDVKSMFNHFKVKKAKFNWLVVKMNLKEIEEHEDYSRFVPPMRRDEIKDAELLKYMDARVRYESVIYFTMQPVNLVYAILTYMQIEKKQSIFIEMLHYFCKVNGYSRSLYYSTSGFKGKFGMGDFWFLSTSPIIVCALIHLTLYDLQFPGMRSISLEYFNFIINGNPHRQTAKCTAFYDDAALYFGMNIEARIPYVAESSNIVGQSTSWTDNYTRMLNEETMNDLTKLEKDLNYSFKYIMEYRKSLINISIDDKGKFAEAVYLRYLPNVTGYSHGFQGRLQKIQLQRGVKEMQKDVDLNMYKDKIKVKMEDVISKINGFEFKRFKNLPELIERFKLEYKDWYIPDDKVNDYTKRLDEWVATTTQEIVTNMVNGNFVLRKDLALKAIDHAPPRSAGGLKILFSVKNDGYGIKGIKNVSEYRLNQKNQIFPFIVNNFVVSNPAEFMIKNMILTTGNRNVVGGKGDRSVTVDPPIKFAKILALRDALNESMDQMPIFEPDTGSTFTTHIGSIYASSNPFVFIDARDYSAFDSTNIVIKRRPMSEEFSRIKVFYDSEHGVTIGDMFRLTDEDRDGQLILIKKTGYDMERHEFIDSIVSYSGLQSGNPLTNRYNDIFNASLSRDSTDRIKSKYGLDSKVRVRGDDSITFFKIMGVRDNNNIKFSDESLKMVKNIIEIDKQVAEGNSMILNTDKGAMATTFSTFLKKTFYYGYSIPNPKVVWFCTELVTEQNRDGIILSKGQTMVERGADARMVYIINMLLQVVMWPKKYEQRKYAVVPYMIMFLEPELGGINMPVNEEVMIFPSSRLFTYMIIKDFMITFKGKSIKYLEFVRFMASKLPKGDRIGRELINKLVKGDFDLIKVEGNWSEMVIDKDISLGKYLNQEKAMQSLVAYKQLNLKPREELVYANINNRAYLKVLDNETSIKQKRLIKEGGWKKTIDGLDRNYKLESKSFTQRLVECVTEVKLVDDIVVNDIVTIMDVSNEQASYLIKVFGHTDGSDSTSLFDMRILNRLLRRGNAPRYITAEVVMDYLTNPQIVYPEGMMENALVTLGVNPDISGELVTMIRNNPMMFSMIQGGSTYSLMSEPLSYVNMSKGALQSVFNQQHPNPIISDLVNVMSVFYLITFRKRPIIQFDEERIQTFMKIFGN